MLKIILMIVVPLIAFTAGAFGGLQLKPGTETDRAEHDTHISQSDESQAAAHPAKTEHPSGGHEADHGSDTTDHGKAPETFTFPSQFFVPLVRRGDSDAMMILTISLQTSHIEMKSLVKQEHRLRDILLRQLLIIANTGGFDGNFTTEGRQRALRKALLEAVQHDFGDIVTAILIEDIVRQDP